MPQVGLELVIPVFERAKTVHALDRVATVIGIKKITIWKYGYRIKNEGSNFVDWHPR
jgi:hypothetical protein